MVVMEELIERNLDLALQTIEPLWQQFHKVDDRVKGDVLYILGQTGQGQMVARLKNILNGEYADEVKEAAREAIEQLS
ncbi:MAG: hypothetical protein PVF98_08210, partial [Desulfobacterales bacterium]|jgi:hypothetical protein